MSKEHEFLFEVTLSSTIPVIVTDNEWQQAQEYGNVDSINELARDKAKRRAPTYLNRETADDGVSEEEIEIGAVLDEWTFKY